MRDDTDFSRLKETWKLNATREQNPRLGLNLFP